MHKIKNNVPLPKHNYQYRPPESGLLLVYDMKVKIDHERFDGAIIINV